MGKIKLDQMEFYAFHGCFAEEKKAGNRFVIDFSFVTSTEKAEITDHINDTVNYQSVYSIIKREMQVTSNLLEHVGQRILNSVMNTFKDIEEAEVKICKMNPPMGGKMKGVSVELYKKRVQ